MIWLPDLRIINCFVVSDTIFPPVNYCLHGAIVIHVFLYLAAFQRISKAFPWAHFPILSLRTCSKRGILMNVLIFCILECRSGYFHREVKRDWDWWEQKWFLLGIFTIADHVLELNLWFVHIKRGFYIDMPLPFDLLFYLNLCM